MTQAQLIADLIRWGINFAFLVPFFFPLYIRFIWAWEKDEWGWNIVLLDWAVAFALLPTFLHRAFGINPNTLLFQWIETISIWQVPAIVIWRSILIWNRQRRRQ